MAAPDLPEFHLPPDMPLAIDVDGTLLRSDITQEMFWLGLLRYPWLAPKILWLVIRDRPALKALLMPKLVDVWTPEHLPYNAQVLDIARAHHASGGAVVLCSGSEAGLIERIAGHFDFIDAGYGTSATLNLVKGNKAAFLSGKYPGGFCYIGNSTQDFTVWPAADLALAIAPPKGTSEVRDARGNPVIILQHREREWGALIEASKPSRAPYALMLTAVLSAGALWLAPDVIRGGKLGLGVFISAAIGTVLAAQGLYIINDIADVARDRADPARRFRPLASGRLSASLSAISGAASIIIGAGLIAATPPPMPAIAAASLLIISSYSLKSLFTPKNS